MTPTTQRLNSTDPHPTGTITRHWSAGVPGAATADFRALGTGVRVVATDPDQLPAVVDAVAAVLRRVDRAASRFRPDSDLTAVNAAPGEPVRVGRDLLDALDVALRAARLTDGLVDPLLGRHLVALGYDRDFALVRAGSKPTPLPVIAPPRRDWRAVEIDRATATVRIPPGSALDLGATAKAWAVDRAVAAAAATGGGGVLVSVGGDLAVAGPPPAAGWPIRVTDDHAAGDPIPGDQADGRPAAGDLADGQTVAIRTGGLATSSTTVRRWTRGGDTLHHLLDPRTLRPAEEVWRTASVVAATCVDANIASTVAVVAGWSARRWLADRGLAARLVTPAGDVVRVAGWPADTTARGPR